MTVKLLTELHLELLGLKGGCTGSSESTHVKMPHCWKSHVAAHMHVHTGDKPFIMRDLWERSINKMQFGIPCT